MKFRIRNQIMCLWSYVCNEINYHRETQILLIYMKYRCPLRACWLLNSTFPMIIITKLTDRPKAFLIIVKCDITVISLSVDTQRFIDYRELLVVW